MFLLDMAVAGIAAQNTALLMEAVTGLTFTPDDVLQVGSGSIIWPMPLMCGKG